MEDPLEQRGCLNNVHTTTVEWVLGRQCILRGQPQLNFSQIASVLQDLLEHSDQENESSTSALSDAYEESGGRLGPRQVALDRATMSGQFAFTSPSGLGVVSGEPQGFMDAHGQFSGLPAQIVTISG